VRGSEEALLDEPPERVAREPELGEVVAMEDAVLAEGDGRDRKSPGSAQAGGRMAATCTIRIGG
jgi:hypothetical protein